MIAPHPQDYVDGIDCRYHNGPNIDYLERTVKKNRVKYSLDTPPVVVLTTTGGVILNSAMYAFPHSVSVSHYALQRQESFAVA